MSRPAPTPPASDAPHDWVFPWRGSPHSMMPKLVATFLCGVGFVLVLTTVQVQMPAMAKSSGRKASVIFPVDDAEGRALAQRAQDGGPFPARFELKSWPGLAQAEELAMKEAAYQMPDHVPELRDLPAGPELGPQHLAESGAAFFPKRESATKATAQPQAVKLTPSLRPLSGIAAADIPRALPPFAGAIDGDMAASPWRFLVRLNEAGVVVDCVSMEKGDEPGSAALEAWLRGVTFAADSKPARWIGLSVQFINRPADGTDPR